MNHNPHNFKVGDRAMLDDQHRVLITGFTPQQLFAQITDDFQQLNGEPWEVMTDRLTPDKMTEPKAERTFTLLEVQNLVEDAMEYAFQSGLSDMFYDKNWLSKELEARK